MAMLRSLMFYIVLVAICIAGSVILVLLIALFSYRSRFTFVRYCNTGIIYAMRYICGIRFVLEGKENIDKQQAMVIAANHQGDWETFFLLTLGIPVTTVLKKELLYIPFFGWALAKLNPIAIDRKKKANALKQVVEQGTKHLQGGVSVLIFPEGTRTRPGPLGQCTKGAAMLAHKAGVPILPIVQNSGHVSSAKSWIKRPGLVRVRIGKPVYGRASKDLHVQMVDWLEDNLAAIESQ